MKLVQCVKRDRLRATGSGVPELGAQRRPICGPWLSKRARSTSGRLGCRISVRFGCAQAESGSSPCSSAATGAKSLRWCTVGPSRRRASRCCGHGVAHVALETVARMVEREAAHQPVARHLGDDRGCGDRRHDRVAADHRIAAASDVDLVAAVDEHMLRPVRQRMHGPRQRPQRRAQDVVAIDARDRGDGDGDLRSGADLLEQHFALVRASASWNRSRPLGMRFGSRMTAAATTGPASGPRPASSQPATSWMPFFRIARSRRNDGRGAERVRPFRLLFLLRGFFRRRLASNHRGMLAKAARHRNGASSAYRRNPRYAQNRLLRTASEQAQLRRRRPSAVRNGPSSALTRFLFSPSLVQAISNRRPIIQAIGPVPFIRTPHCES